MKAFTKTIGLLLLFNSLIIFNAWSGNPAELSDANDTTSLFSYFVSMTDQAPTIKINTKVNRLVNKKMKEEEQPGQLSFIGPNGEWLTTDIMVRSRGNIRKEVCYYPPIRLNLVKSVLKEMGFTNHDKLKMVLECRNNKAGKAYVTKEYLTYQLYSLIDPFHVQTKFVTVELWDGDELKKTLDGFFVEEERHIADRLNGRVLEKGNILTPSLQRDHYLKMVFFQYMIANTDWAIKNKHNVEIMKLQEFPRVVAIPYDFDYSGLVGTDYAIPQANFPISNVRQRYFRGLLVTEEEAMELAQYFLSMKDAFIKCCEEAWYLDDKNRESVLKFLDGFFKTLESEKSIKKTYVTAKK